jgi:multidrug efflux pump subunit AcrB
VKEQSLINEVLPRVQKELTEKYPDAQIISKRFLLGPGEGGRVQVRFSGENYNILRPLAAQAMEILRADGGAKGIRIDSREPVPTLRPQFSEVQARLIDEINAQLASGKPPWDAVVDASVSRVRPVSMAVLTTVFGLFPLLFDVFFGAMAVTIVVGLLFASALTLFVVPVLYVIFFKVRPEKPA